MKPSILRKRQIQRPLKIEFKIAKLSKTPKPFGMNSTQTIEKKVKFGRNTIQNYELDPEEAAGKKQNVEKIEHKMRYGNTEGSDSSDSDED